MASPRVFISAGEASGDLHGATLARALRRLDPAVDLAGLGGPRMAAAGVRLHADTTAFGVIGVAPIFGAVGRYLHLWGRADRFLASWRPDVAVTIDCPGWHFLLASRLRARQIPTVWYVPPQLWAWAPWRVRKLRRRFAHVACVLPHEQQFFEAAGVPCTFVGHPVLDHLRAWEPDAAFIRSLRREPTDTLVALLPGSRKQEVAELLRREAAVAQVAAGGRDDVRFVVPLADASHRAWAAPALAETGLEARVVVGRTHEVQKAADLALVASGTATLELAYYGTPMVVFYNVGRIEWNLLGRWLLRTPYVSLPNVLAGRPIVREFWRRGAPAAPEIDTVRGLLRDEAARARMRDALLAIRSEVDRPDAGANAARIVLEHAGRAVPPPPAWRPGFAM